MTEIAPPMYLAAMFSLSLVGLIIAILGDLGLIQEQLTNRLIELLLIPCLVLSALVFVFT